MKARVTSLNKDKGYMEIDLIDSGNKVRLSTQVSICDNLYIKIFYCFKVIATGEHYVSLYDEMKKAKCILVKNIGKIIGKVFWIFDYDESEVKSIEFHDNCVAYVTLNKWTRKGKQNGTDIEK